MSAARPHYEWDVEVVSAEDTEHLCAGDIIDHNFFETALEAVKFLRATAEAGTRKELVLVRTGVDGERVWAYCAPDTDFIPLHFSDAHQQPSTLVPSRFLDELKRANAGLLP